MGRLCRFQRGLALDVNFWCFSHCYTKIFMHETALQIDVFSRFRLKLKIEPKNAALSFSLWMKKALTGFLFQKPLAVGAVGGRPPVVAGPRPIFLDPHSEPLRPFQAFGGLLGQLT